MKIKLIATDLDGTFLSYGNNITKENLDAVKKAAMNKINVVVCTGRAFGEIPDSVKNIKDIKYFITSNGASITNNNNVIYSNPIPRDISDQIMKILKKYNCMLDLYINNEAFMQKSFTKMLQSYGLNNDFYDILINSRVMVDNIHSFYKTNNALIEKINLFFGNVDERINAIKELSYITPQLHITNSMKNNVEITSSTCNKGSGLIELCKILNISNNEILSIGDSNNDIPMFKISGCAVSMENAPDEVQKQADFITDSCEKSGAGKAILNYGLGKF